MGESVVDVLADTEGQNDLIRGGYERSEAIGRTAASRDVLGRGLPEDDRLAPIV